MTQDAGPTPFSTSAERQAAGIVWTDLAVRLHDATQRADAGRADQLRTLLNGLAVEYLEAVDAEKRLFKSRY